MIYRHRKGVIVWLAAGCLLVFAMLIVGGITRLTGSGLSMTEWNPLMGAMPPLNELQWEELFAKYRQFPEYVLVNYNFSLDDFKRIFWWEYIHRLLGRLTGLVFIIPLIVFIRRGCFSMAMVWRCVVIFALGALQGAIGWYMVKSGLADVPHVNHYRLALHLSTAFALFGYIFWVLLDVLYQGRRETIACEPILRTGTLTALVLFGIQVIYGAFMAGLKAGRVYNTFPMMGDSWVAEGVMAMTPLWRNFTEGPAGVQFVHRYTGMAMLLIVLLIWLVSLREKLNGHATRGFHLMAIFALIQFILGVITLLKTTPPGLAVLHQAGALLLLGALLFCTHALTAAAHGGQEWRR